MEKAIEKLKEDDSKYSKEIEQYQKVVHSSKELSEEIMNQRLDENEDIQKVRDEVERIQENELGPRQQHLKTLMAQYDAAIGLVQNKENHLNQINARFETAGAKVEELAIAAEDILQAMNQEIRDIEARKQLVHDATIDNIKISERIKKQVSKNTILEQQTKDMEL